jgi:hypothetical protein
MRADTLRPVCGLAQASAVNPSHGVAMKRYNRGSSDGHDVVVRPGRRH